MNNGDIKKIEKVIEQLEDLMRCYLAAGLIGEYIGLKVAMELLLREVDK